MTAVQSTPDVFVWPSTRGTVAALSDGGYIVFSGDTDSRGLWGQRYDMLGGAVGGRFLAAAGGGYAVATALADGNIAVAWRSVYAAGGYPDRAYAFVQKISPDGVSLTGIVSTTYTVDVAGSDALQIAAYADGSIVVGLATGRYSQGTGVGLANFVSGAGLVTTGIASGQASGGDLGASLAINDDFTLVAYANRNAGGGDVWIQKVTREGAPISTAVSINHIPLDQDPQPSRTATAVLSDGKFVVLWTSTANVYGQMLAADGVTLVGSSFTVNTTLSGYQINPRVVALKDGGFFVIWSGEAIVGQQFDSTGAKVGGEVFVPTGGSAVWPELDVLTDGRVVISWSQARGGDTPAGVHTAIFDPRGAVINGDTDGNALVGRDQTGDVINGHDGHDVLFGLGGNDTLTGGAGDDQLYGGAGFDTAIFGGLPGASYTIDDLGRGIYLITTADGVDRVEHVERLVIAGTEILLPTYRGLGNDADNDGDSDIFYYSAGRGGVMVASMTPTGITSRVVGDPGGGAWDARGVGDFNGDGHADIVLRDNGGYFSFWSTQNGSRYASTAINSGSTTLDIGSTGDYDGDGLWDLLWRDSSNGELKISNFSADLTVSSTRSLGVLGINWTVAKSGDFNGDGVADILLRNITDGAIYIWTMADSQVSGGQGYGALGTNWTIAGTGDFNGDGRDDVALKNASTGQFYMWLMNTDLSYVGANQGTIGTSWNIISTGDFDGDGTDDLYWRNGDTGVMSFWSMDNGQVNYAASHRAQIDVNTSFDTYAIYDAVFI